MTTQATGAEVGYWRKIWRWLRAFDEAMHDDPSSILNRKINRLEKRLLDQEAKVRTFAERED